MPIFKKTNLPVIDGPSHRTSHITRIDLRLNKGHEELLPEEIYSMISNSGIWIVEEKNDTILRVYPDDIRSFLDILYKSCIRPKEIIIRKEKQQDYSALTKKYFRPIKIEDVTIAPPWGLRKINGKQIIIEPGMAFGTGRHESTRIMIKLMGQLGFKGKKVLDIGCGSGILSFYANLLGSTKIISIDVDMNTVLSAKKNIMLNKTKVIELVCTDLQNIKGLYDIVLANLDIQAFTLYSNHIRGRIKKGGHIVLSGILTRNKKDIISLLHPMTLIREDKKNSWWGFVFRNDAGSL